jgi:hypothetical protein
MKKYKTYAIIQSPDDKGYETNDDAPRIERCRKKLNKTSQITSLQKLFRIEARMLLMASSALVLSPIFSQLNDAVSPFVFINVFFVFRSFNP